jgi:hypothetical protein
MRLALDEKVVERPPIVLLAVAIFVRALLISRSLWKLRKESPVWAEVLSSEKPSADASIRRPCVVIDVVPSALKPVLRKSPCSRFVPL